MKEIRALRADEVECRVSQVKENGVVLLLYKDARCDMNILDETLGPTNWQRRHTRDNANCIVSIWDDEKQQWIEKEDTGTESNTEQEKGLASDSFKRACFNVGIGRELYTAPFIWVKAADCTITKGSGGKPACYDKFKVANMTVENKKITALGIENLRTHEIVYTFTAKKPAQRRATAQEEAAQMPPMEEALRWWEALSKTAQAQWNTWHAKVTGRAVASPTNAEIQEYYQTYITKTGGKK